MNPDYNIDVEESISRGIDFLVSKQNENGSVTLDNDATWDVWETANAILAVHMADNNKKEFLEKAINFLSTAQRDDGSFCHTISFAKGDYCMETTPACVLALDAAERNVDKTVHFMLDIQHQDGSWDIGNPGIIKRRHWPSVTGFVLNTLLLLDVKSNQISKGIDFLLKKQQRDGSWGSNWVYYDTPYYPIHVILSALKLYGLGESNSYKKSLCFICKNQARDGSWCLATTGKPRPSISLRTSLALNSLLISPKKTDIKYIESGINWLVKEQEDDGRWDGGYFVNWADKKEDIYATSIAIISLEKYKGYHKK